MSKWSQLKFALKGGTVLNRVYLGDNGRFSEDLDIDIFGNLSIDDKLKELKNAAKRLLEYKIEGPRILHLTARFDAFYINEFGDKDRVMLEFYLANKKPVVARPIESILIHSRFIETSPAMFPCYSLEDLIAQKLVTLSFRGRGKDIYDLFYALDLTHDSILVKEALIKRLALRGKTINPDDFFKSLLDQEEKFLTISAQLKNSINHYIPRDQRPNWKIFISTLFDKLKDYSKK